MRAWFSLTRYTLACFLASSLCCVQAEDLQSLIEQAQSLIPRTNGTVFRDVVKPHWIPGTPSFWYQVSTAPDAHEYVRVDAHTGSLKRAATLAELDIPVIPPAKSPSNESRSKPKNQNKSPDDQWSVRLEKHNVELVAPGGESIRLTTDGTEQHPYRGPITWSPDSRHCVVLRVREVKHRSVSIVESSPTDQLQPKLTTFEYFKPGDAIPEVSPAVICVATRSLKIISDDLFKNGFTPSGTLPVRWSPRGDEFYFDHNQRGHQVYRVLAVNPATGGVRTVVEEQSKTFIEWTKVWREWMDHSGELLWLSERDGWRHLWLYDVAKGVPKSQLTRGEWVVREVLRVDAQKRQVWFLAAGIRNTDEPYYRHLCRVNFDGSGFVQLTDGEGDHDIVFSPDFQYFIDRWSRVDQPWITELRRCEDGSRVCELERADISRLVKTGWSTPERFSATGRDDKTLIYGVMIKPSSFDPKKKYPVVEEVYAGPHGYFAPKTFNRLLRQHVIADLGFIVVQVDGMGTNHRGKAFQDVCWKNLEDAGFPDRIKWIRAAAATRPWMDLSRVGIYGGSAGGQTAMRALIAHSDFYSVAVADCGCHDNRMDKIWWNEQWLGWPVDESYIRSSNVAHAAKLNGKLLLIVGELDRNVDPASTLQAVGALQRAGKSFEYMPIINTGHGAAETPYGSKLRLEFFAKHLLGKWQLNSGS